jgi:hypothetical protein
MVVWSKAKAQGVINGVLGGVKGSRHGGKGLLNVEHHVNNASEFPKLAIYHDKSAQHRTNSSMTMLQLPC